MALKEATKEHLWLRTLFNQIPELKDKGYNDYILYTDSQSAIELAKNPEHHARTKHIDIQYHFVRENTQNGLINLKYISTNQQLADGLTKALDPIKFKYYTTSIGLKDLVSPKD